MRTPTRKSALMLASLLAPATAALAVDGVVLIDQNRANFGGVTPGDGPGFPVTLSEPGSYRLSGNLTANGTAIEITANHVTLDLNGFRLIGDRSGDGVSENEMMLQGIAVSNGTVTNFSNGIQFPQSSAIIEGVRVIGNVRWGIAVGRASTVTNNTANGNGSVGIISFGDGSRVANNTASGNGLIGISAADAEGSTVSGNIAHQNGREGIVIQCPGNAIGNTATGSDLDNLATVPASGSGCNLSENVAP